MAFTQTDLETIETAIMKLTAGQKAVDVTIRGKSIRYVETSLDQLQTLRVQIQRELGLVATRVYAKNGGRG
jgi:hypothetical protein